MVDHLRDANPRDCSDRTLPFGVMKQACSAFQYLLENCKVRTQTFPFLLEKRSDKSVRECSI